MRAVLQRGLRMLGSQTGAASTIVGAVGPKLPWVDAKLAGFVASPRVRAEPWGLYRALRERDPVHRTPIGVWFVSGYEYAQEVLRHPHVSVDEGYATAFAAQRSGQFNDVLGQSLLFLDPPDHHRLRRLVARAFTPKRVDSLRPRIRQIVADHLERLADVERFDVLADFAYPVPVAVICELLGIPSEEWSLLHQWAPRLAARLEIEPLRSTDVEREGDQAAEAFAHYIADLIADPGRRSHDGLLTALVSAEEDGETLTHREIVATCALLLMAGHETTANLVGNGVYALLGHPNQLRLLTMRAVDASAAVEELLRFDSPVQMTQRIAVSDVELAGKTIPSGSLVVVLVGAANRDPAVFPDPDELRLEREPRPHLAFSVGIHVCLGASLARLEAAEMITQLFDRLGQLRLEHTPRRRNSFVLRGFSDLPVTTTRR
jgi:cytochrome P450